VRANEDCVYCTRNLVYDLRRPERHMQKIVVFIFSTAMLAAGLYIIIGDLLYSSDISLLVLGVGIALGVLGAYLLWTDFADPALNIRTWED
jgi:energy-converting hydrogenase Eha subunit A